MRERKIEKLERRKEEALERVADSKYNATAHQQLATTVNEKRQLLNQSIEAFKHAHAALDGGHGKLPVGGH